MSISQSLVPTGTSYVIDSSKYADAFHNFHSLPHMSRSGVRTNFTEFYYNYTAETFPLIRLYNPDFIQWISQKIKVQDTSKNIDIMYFVNFYNMFAEFVLGMSTTVANDLLYLCLYHRLVHRIKHDVGMLFKSAFVFYVPASNSQQKHMRMFFLMATYAKM